MSTALIRLHKRLIAQRDELRRKLTLPAPDFGHDVGGDAADMALHDVERELESQLVSLESRELVRIEKAIDAIRNGTYGQCEHCGNKIPVARLQALPHTSCCIECQRKFELRQQERGTTPDWESAWNFESSSFDSDLTMRDIQLDID